jgi:phosphonate transport system ATP-binding protein
LLTTPVIRTSDLGKAYAPGQFAIRHISLDVHAGDFIAIIGRSGAGKSTLLRCLNLLIRPTEGRLELRGEDVTHSSGRRLRDVRGRVGMIFQGFNLVRRLTVLDNVLTGRLRFRTSPVASLLGALRRFPSDERERAFECLKRVNIEHLAYRRADTLSGGQQQRVAIARVLAQEPDVILADEPIASLDPQSAQAVMSTLREIHDLRGIPVVVNLHQVEIARAYASRIVGVAAGRVRVDAAPADLTPEAVLDVYGQSHAQASELVQRPSAPTSEPAVVTMAGVHA